MEDGHHMEENIAKFGEKLKQLVAHGKKNKKRWNGYFGNSFAPLRGFK